MDIHAEGPEDIEAIHHIHVAAFGREGEATLVDHLREEDSTLSFVAVESGQIVGHILFSPVSVDGSCPNDLLIFGLAPVGVLPSFQNQGIGSRLIRHGLEECARFGGKAVVVLGDPNYYTRFGFSTAKQKGLGCEYPVPDDVFMVLELEPGILTGCSGTVKYRPEFNELE